MSRSVDRSLADLIKKTSRYRVLMLNSLILNRLKGTKRSTGLYLIPSMHCTPQLCQQGNGSTVDDWWIKQMLMICFWRLSALSSAILNMFLSRVIKSHLLFKSEGFQLAFYRPTERRKSDPSDIVHCHCHWSLDSGIHLMFFEMQTAVFWNW